MFCFYLLSLAFLSTFKAQQVFPPTSKGDFINCGTPDAITLSFDCAVREYAYEYGKVMQPQHGTFVELFDALQLQACNVTRPRRTLRKISKYPKHDLNDLSSDPCIFYVDPVNGDDSNSGQSPNDAFLTIEKAVDATRSTRDGNQLCTINLMEGTFYQQDTIFLTSQDSFLTIQNYNGADVIISGGVPLEFESNWTLVQFNDTKWVEYSGWNNVYGRVNPKQSNDFIKYIGSFNSYDDCQQAVESAISNGSRYNSFTWHDSNQGAYSYNCFALPDISWGPVYESGHYSGRYEGRNIWQRKVSNINDLNNNRMDGLRINNMRSIRARYPDQIPEIAMQYFALSGWISYPTKFEPPQSVNTATDIVKNANDYPDVEWPMDGPGGTTWTGMGDWGDFWVGVGGYCEHLGVDPPYGYWCSSDPPRQTSIFRAPSGIYLDPGAGLNLPYSSGASDAVLQVWRPYHWFSWMFNISSYDSSSNYMQFDYGGTQGAQGETTGDEWYIENVFEELTMPNEYFYNRSTNILYYYYNSTSQTPPPEDTLFVATKNKVLFNISGSFRQQDGPPAQNITIQGLTLRDTGLTFMDPHGLPSGGDWGMARKGAIYLQGTENVIINDLFMTRLDGNGIFIYAYNRNLTVENCTFEWLGESAMVSWGYTEGLEDTIPGIGPDGRLGNQPRYTTVRNNLAREIGVYEKQVSMWFQAQTAQTYFSNNIFFNGPRAGINVNDGFGGDNWLVNNLVINTCRESQDHGNFNSWDRMPFITNIGNASGSIIPAYNHVINNFWMGTYQITIPIDNDDGSAYYNTHDNFFVYGEGSLKSDFSGHDNRHHNNLYGYTNGASFLFYEAGYNDWFTQNSAIYTSNSDYTSNCNLPSAASDMTINNNSIYVPDPNTFTVCNVDFNTWQSNGNDPGTTINPLPSDNQIIQMAKDLLGH